jgi:hypothetical protein
MMIDRKVVVVKMPGKAEKFSISDRFGSVVPVFLRASVSLW